MMMMSVDIKEKKLVVVRNEDSPMDNQWNT